MTIAIISSIGATARTSTVFTGTGRRQALSGDDTITRVRHAIAMTPSGQSRAAPYTVLGCVVTDMAASVRDLVATGVRFERFADMNHDELGIWTTPGGDMVAWFKDPDGNVLSLTQFGGLST